MAPLLTSEASPSSTSWQRCRFEVGRAAPSTRCGQDGGIRRKSATDAANLARGERLANWVAKRPVARPSGGAGKEEAEAEAEAEAKAEDSDGSEEGEGGAARWGASQRNGNR